MTRKELANVLRHGPYTSIGCHPVFLLCADGETMHVQCCKANAKRELARVTDKADRERVIGYDVNWEDPDMYCAECGERIESAYAEPEEETP